MAVFERKRIGQVGWFGLPVAHQGDPGCPWGR